MGRRFAVTGAKGQLGRQLVDVLVRAGHAVLPLARPDFDITSARDLLWMSQWRPEIVINAAAWTDVDGCARDPKRAMEVNGHAAGQVAAAAARAGALIVQISSNEVFDGTLDRAYAEDEAPNPINAYGASKLAGERLVAETNPQHLIVRTAWLFGPQGTNFVTKILAAARGAQDDGESLPVVEDEYGNPTPTPDFASVLVDTALERRGRLHLVGTPPASRLDWARVILDEAGIEVELEPISRTTFRRTSTPPARAVLQPSVGLAPIQWVPAIRRYVAELSGERRGAAVE